MSNQVRFKPNKGFDANALTIINLADPINPTDAATMEWVQAQIAANGGSTVNAGTALVNFGTGSSDTLTVITGQTGILSTSILQCTISPAVTSNNGIDEHWVENLAVSAGNIVAGVGFTIYAKCTFGKAFGNFNIAWSWI